MIRDITIGQYYSGESPIHKLDPRVKIMGTLIYIIGLFLVKTFVGFAFVFAMLMIFVGISKVPISYILRGLKPVFLIVIFTFILNMFMIKGEVIASFWILEITKEGLYTAVFMAIRLFLLIICSSLLTLTTKPINLTDGIESLLKPFERFGMPAHELAMMMSIALRFIPTLLEETDKIMKAQMARGADFETGNIFRRAKNLIPILVPLFISAFRIAQDMAMAMESRCYRGGKNRTRMNGIAIRRADVTASIIIALTFAAIIAERIFLG